MKRTFPIAAAVWFMTMITGCTLPQPDDLRSKDSAFPTSGTVSNGTAFCPATLIAPSHVVTARRCVGAGAVFEVGDLVVPIDTVSDYPGENLVLGHLATPVHEDDLLDTAP